MFKTCKTQSTFKVTLVSIALSALMTGNSFGQAAGGQGGGGSGGGSPGSGTFQGSVGLVPSNSNRAASPHPNPHNRDRNEPPDYRGCNEQRTSRNNTNQKACDNRRLRVIVQ